MDEKLEKFPLYIKANEIYELVNKVSILIENNGDEDDFDNHILNEYKNQMNENALIIPAKIAGVFPEDVPYDLKMENAAIIRKAAEFLLI